LNLDKVVQDMENKLDAFIADVTPEFGKFSVVFVDDMALPLEDYTVLGYFETAEKAYAFKTQKSDGNGQLFIYNSDAEVIG